MGFKKLALAVAVAAAPMSALALEPMQDDALSSVTGQDGITIGLNANIAASLIVHDTDGIAGFASTSTTQTYTYTTTAGTVTGTSTPPPGSATSVTTNTNVNSITDTSYNNAAALVMDDFALNTNGGEITLEIDAGDNDANGGAPVLNVKVGIPTGTVITLGEVDIANSNRDNSGGWGVESTGRVDGVINLGSLTLGATTMNIQLANEPQGDMIALATTIDSGITLNNFAINDANSGGGIGVASLQVVGNGVATGDLAVDAGINVTGTGLTVRVDQLGSATGADVRMTDVSLGAAGSAALGDIELVGLNLNGTTVRISGH